MERAKPFEDFSIEQPSLAGLGSGVSAGGGVDRLMSQQLSHHLIVAGVEVEEDLACGVPEQVDVELEPEKFADCLLDLETERVWRLRPR